MSLYFRVAYRKYMHAPSASIISFSKRKCHDGDLRNAVDTPCRVKANAGARRRRARKPSANRPLCSTGAPGSAPPTAVGRQVPDR